jgi:methyl-accepting chemotaxis protein
MNKFITNLTLRGKFLLVTLATMVPLAVLCFVAASLQLEKMSIARTEDEGLRWASELIAIAANVSEYREHAAAVAAGAENERSELAEHAGLIREAAANLDKLSESGDSELATISDWSALRPRVTAVLEGTGADESQQTAMHELIADLHVKVQHVADHSALVLDPGVDTFALMYSALFDIPKGVEALASSRRAMDAIAAGDTSVGVHMALAAEASNARIRLGNAMRQLVDNYSPQARKGSPIPGPAKQQQGRLEAALVALDTEARQNMSRERALALSNEVELLTEDLSELRVLANVELSALLHARASASQWTLAIEVLVVLLGVAFAYWMQVRVSTHITRNLGVANQVFGELANGKFDNAIEVESQDELGELLQSLAKMQGGLAGRVEADRRAAAEERERAVAAERIKQALDASSVNVVVCDDQFDVIYLNPAAQTLMRSAQADFARVSPRFEASRLVGMNVEVFYQDGARQRDVIAAARQATTAQFVVGSRTLQSTASPIFDSSGKRLGTVIEWLDRTQEVAAEKEIGDLVSAVSDGKLDQRISLKNKTGFFEVLATGLNGLVTAVNDVVSDLKRLVEGANEGDLTRSMELDGHSGLYVSIGSGINSLVGNMAGVVSQVKSMAAEVHTGAEEISRGNTNLSQRTEEQASSLEETASSMEEMTSTVKQTADNAGQANQLAMAARQQAERGGAVVGSAVSAMNGINDASKKIADIIGVIDEIAFQTNLLALNAAVEAARAGEQGRGFAVVATEVRNLAGRSATAAKEIKALIQDSVAKVEEGSRLVDESGKTLEEIVQAVKKVTDIVAEIAAASREQSSGIEQVNKAIMQMDGNTQQNAALVEEAAAASQAIVEQALLLNSIVSHYRIAASANVERSARRAKPQAAPAKIPAPAGKAPAPARQAPMRKVSGSDAEWTDF